MHARSSGLQQAINLMGDRSSSIFPTECFPMSLLATVHTHQRPSLALCLLWQSGRAEQIRAAATIVCVVPKKKRRTGWIYTGLPLRLPRDFGDRLGGCSRGCGDTWTMGLGTQKFGVRSTFPRFLPISMFVVFCGGRVWPLAGKGDRPEGHVRLFKAFSSTPCRDKGATLDTSAVHFAQPLS